MKRILRPFVRASRNFYQRIRVVPIRMAGVEVIGDAKVYGRLRVKKWRKSRIVVGRGVTLNASVKRNTLEARGPTILQTLRPGAVIEIGTDTGMTSATISAGVNVRIGERVLIGAGVLITDSDHHVVEPGPGEKRRFMGLPLGNQSHSVLIGDDVFLGARSIVLKGVNIGDGSVVGAGSVVTQSIPPFSVAAGNPCRVIRNLKG